MSGHHARPRTARGARISTYYLLLYRFNRSLCAFLSVTGHAFQVLVGDDELRASLTAIRQALTDGGRFAFEPRNPLARAWESWCTPLKGRKTLPCLTAVHLQRYTASRCSGSCLLENCCFF